MSSTERNPRVRLPRYTLRHLGVILAAYVVYGVLLLGTSALIAPPDHAFNEPEAETLEQLVTGLWPTEFAAWLRENVNAADGAP
jgi:hypothetical protein